MKKYSLTEKNECTFYLKIYGENSIPIYKMLNKILVNSVYNNETTALFLNAESVVPLQKYISNTTDTMSLSRCIKMMSDLSWQIKYLKTKNYGMYGLDLDDILVINDNTFFIASTKHLTNINAKDYYIYFYKPIVKPYFSSPELNELTKLPAKIDYRSSYYSLGALILFCSTNIYIFAEQIEEEQNLLEILEPINYTKTYWFLKRCFYKNCKERILLFI